MAKRPLFDQVAIIGLGLIGGSLGMALRRGRVARRVIGFSRREATIRRARARGAIDDGCTELCPDWLSESDLVVIATPPAAVPRVARQVARMARRPLILTDVASTKAEIVRSIERMLPRRVSFVGAHPMAGSERSGIEHADARLFDGATCIVTPTPRTRPAALARVASLWRRVGCRVECLSPERHDALVAQVSHVPHLAAVGLALFPERKALRLSAGGFADATRIALADPSLWEEVCRTNSRQVARALARLISELSAIRKLVQRDGGAGLRGRFEAARRRRRRIGR
ncbi:MAG: prephenate dehydrogenase/arogenate dehydrogenase family protein [Candidatus Omnitrophica bacterium]|nr:prephenate dehydrogenase/arogenate dehydrogenase family protein [Candidatus Omnitrophota bacterium]